MHSLKLEGGGGVIEFHLSALSENADCAKPVFINLAEQLPLTGPLVYLALSLQNDTFFKC